jgi:branched-chain amino acid transport system ATP-binding protein
MNAVAGTANLLEVSGLTVRYGSALALDELDLTLKAGEVRAVLGTNGAGKSSLARAISGLVPVTKGSIRFDGNDITKLNANRTRTAGLIYLPEGRGVFPGLTVADNIRMATGKLRRGERSSAETRAYDLFPSLARRKSQLAGQLSGGEQQMLSLTRALVTSPKLIIADEMSLGLAPQLVDLVFESLELARRDGVAIIMIEQFVHRALAFADTATVVQRGRLVWSGAASEGAEQAMSGYLGHSPGSPAADEALPQT